MMPSLVGLAQAGGGLGLEVPAMVAAPEHGDDQRVGLGAASGCGPLPAPARIVSSSCRTDTARHSLRRRQRPTQRLAIEGLRLEPLALTHPTQPA